MKKRTKALLLSFCAVALVAGSVFGTMAYLTDHDTVTNTFTVGKVDIKLDEAKANTDGTLVADADRVQANDYHLIPGHTYNKDPMVTVLKGSESAYIKMIVTVNKASQLDAIFAPTGADLTSIFKGYDKNNWTLNDVSKDTTANTRTYEFWYKEAVAAPDTDVALDPLFDQIVVPGEITGEQLATLYTSETDRLTITINAYAMQADGFEKAADAWSNW